jgi:hypothetical protein
MIPVSTRLPLRSFSSYNKASPESNIVIAFGSGQRIHRSMLSNHESQQFHRRPFGAQEVTGR